MKKIIQAKWIIPIVHPPIQDGAILIERGKILKVGKAEQILKKTDAQARNLGNVIVLPGLVNAHTHLEYSSLKGRIRPRKNFITWLEHMIRLKRQCKKSQMKKAAKEAIRNLFKRGTRLVGEVTNTGLTAKWLQQEGLAGAIFYELVANQSFQDYMKAEKKLRRQAPHFQISPAPHASHTVPKRLLAKIQNHIRRQRKITSIHLAESREEKLWIRDKKGPFSKLLKDPALVENPDFGKGRGGVEYLQKQDFLNPRTLCVHCAHASFEEIKILKKSGSPVVLCPRSNQYTGTELPPVRAMMRLKIPLCLGTDSLASNSDLDLWNEMRHMKKSFPFLSYPSILRMATLEGARALGFGRIHGSIEKGKKAALIYVKSGSKNIRDPYKFLIETKHGKVFSYPS